MLPLDREVFWFLHSWTGHSNILDGLFIFFAKYLFWFILVWVLWILIRKKDWPNKLSAWKNRFQYFSLGLISLILSRGIIANIMSALIQSPRPFATLDIQALINHADVSSIPSGHMASVIPIVLTLFLMNKKAGWWGLIMALLIGISRVIVGVHWPSDIILGLVVGIFSFYFVYWLFRKGKAIN